MSDRIYINDRDPNAWSVRSALADLSAKDTENFHERDVLLKYQDTLRQLNQKEQELYDTRELFSNIHAGDDRYYLSVKKSLQDTATRISAQIDTLERRLSFLQEDPTLKIIIYRERAAWLEKEKQRGEEALERYRERELETQRKLMEQYRESRQIKEPKAPDQLHTTQHNTNSSLKEKLTVSLGSFGIVLFWLLRLFISILPFVMIGGNFFITFLLITINTLVPFASAVFWIWGLICAIKGVQDFFAIMFYIAFIVIWLPFYINLIRAIIVDLASKKN